MTGTVIGNLIVMDAIGISVGLASANFGSNEGYTIFAGEFALSTAASGQGYKTILTKEFANPVQGIMGWFGSYGRNGLSTNSALLSASQVFTKNILNEPLFLAPSASYNPNTWGETGTEVDSLRCLYTAGSSSTVDFDVICSSGAYGAFCCFFYIFF